MITNDIIHKKYNFDGYNIETLDNAFSVNTRARYYDIFKKSNFNIGWEDTNEIETQSNKFLYSEYREKDLDRLSLAKDICNTEFGREIFTKYSVSRCVLNLSKPGDIYINHTHIQSKVLLYYGNIRWQDEWCGETLFYNDNMKEILFASPYIPGRFILFDGNLPHTIRAQTSNAPHYRFTFSIFLNNK